MHFETENQVKLESKLEDLDKEYSKIIDDSNEIKKALPDKQKQLITLQNAKENEEAKLSGLNNAIKENAKKLVKQKKDLE